MFQQISAQSDYYLGLWNCQFTSLEYENVKEFIDTESKELFINGSLHN